MEAIFKEIELGDLVDWDRHRGIVIGFIEPGSGPVVHITKGNKILRVGGKRWDEWVLAVRSRKVARPKRGPKRKAIVRLDGGHKFGRVKFPVVDRLTPLKRSPRRLAPRAGLKASSALFAEWWEQAPDQAGRQLALARSALAISRADVGVHTSLNGGTVATLEAGVGRTASARLAAELFIEEGVAIDREGFATREALTGGLRALAVQVARGNEEAISMALKLSAPLE